MKWLDVTPDKWFYRDINELTDIIVKVKQLNNNGEVVESEQNFYSGIAYNDFISGKEAVDYEFIATNKQIEFRIPSVVNPTSNNPLVVYVNGINVAIDKITPNSPSGKTYIKLTRPLREGSVVRAVYSGEPKMSVFIGKDNTPVLFSIESSLIVDYLMRGDHVNLVSESGNYYQVSYPRHKNVFIEKTDAVRIAPAVITGNPTYPYANLTFDSGYSYLYDPYEGYTSEVVKCNGRQLMRVESQNDLGFPDRYYIDTQNNRIYVSYELNKETIEANFLERNLSGIIKIKYLILKPSSNYVKYINRFFPDVFTTRAELIKCIDMMRMYFIEKYTDSEPYMSTKTTSRFADVNAILQASVNPPWWWNYVRNIEDLKFKNGAYLLTGVGRGNLGIDLRVTRAEAVALMDKFRMWFIEVFK